MRLTRFEGRVIHLQCVACCKEGIGGTDPYISASTGEARTPEEWYYTEDTQDQFAYCAECAAKLTETDPTRSRTRFYLDTAGTQIAPEIYGS